MPDSSNFKVYPMRWFMLVIFMVLTAMNQMLWITFAPITKDASAYFHVTDLQIGILSVCFMLVYILISIPASWIIDTYGIRIGVGIGAVFTGVFGLMRGFVADDFNLVLVAQIGIAIGQPFILNAITKLAARWFPMEERATAAGLGTLAMYVGILAGIMISPFIATNYGMDFLLKLYGILAIVSAFIFLIFAKESPKSPPGDANDEIRALVFDGLKNIFKIKDFNWLMLIFFIGLGVFNSLTTWIENILNPRGFSNTQAGMAGGYMIIGGIIGALVIPILSDHFQKRKPFIVIALFGATLGLIGLSFATSYILLLISCGVLGFFLLSSGPIGFQYGAEITHPISEGTSNGMLLLIGQISGIAFIFAMDYFKSAKTGSMELPLIALIVLMIVSIFISLKLKESKRVSGAKNE